MGQISAITIHAHGPQEYPKKTTKSQIMATAAQPAAEWEAQESWFFAVMTATIMWQVAMPIAPPGKMLNVWNGGGRN